MSTKLFFVSVIANYLGNLLALIIGLVYCYRNHHLPYVKIFLLYLFVSIAVEVLAVPEFFHLPSFWRDPDFARIVTYNLFKPFELFIFSWFFLQIIQSRRVKRILVGSIVSYSILFACYSWVVGIGSNIIQSTTILESIILLIPCLTWYRELFTHKESVNLIREPEFWLVTGIFFYLCAIIPFASSITYLVRHGLFKLGASLSSINTFSYLVTYCLFVKGFTCRSRLKALPSDSIPK